ncbi:hypothetical protein IC232_04570 [Microvirga sp. BT688]|uniref:hypothetical protein n=1 Tax=Microvirga sp. TaxID=1873136 RepID=UPI0016858775|nr:hypothetical protein [Microvirga sp.]MBD2745969.1 hypothetical protein [Microvirga sp.]
MAKLGEAPVLVAVLAFLALAIADLILGTSFATVFLMFAVLPATFYFVRDHFRPSPVQKRIASLATSSLQRYVTLAEITVEAPLVSKTGSLILMLDRRSRRVSDGMESFRLLQEGALRQTFVIAPTIRFHRDGVADIELSRHDLKPVRIRVDLRRGLTRITLRETVPDDKNPFVNEVRSILSKASLDSVADIRKARIRIAQLLKVDTCLPAEKANRTAAMAFANDRLDSRKKELFGQ